MSEVVKLQLQIEEYREARRTIAAVLKDTRKATDLSKEQKKLKIQTLNASRAEIRQLEKAAKKRLELARRAKALRDKGGQGGFSRLGARLSKAGGNIAAAQSAVDLVDKTRDLFSRETFDSSFTEGVPKALDLAGDVAAAAHPAVGAIVKMLNATVIQPLMRAIQEETDRRMSAFEKRVSARTDRALRSFEQRIADDPRFANKLAEKNGEARRAYQAIQRDRGLVPREQALLEFH